MLLKSRTWCITSCPQAGRAAATFRIVGTSWPSSCLAVDGCSQQQWRQLDAPHAIVFARQLVQLSRCRSLQCQTAEDRQLQSTHTGTATALWGHPMLLEQCFKADQKVLQLQGPACAVIPVVGQHFRSNSLLWFWP